MKIIPNYPDVVIGSRTVTEYKFQILNFMNLLYDSIINDKCNLSVWTHNLKYEIGRVNKEEPIKYYDIDTYIYGRINTILINLKTDNSKETKNLCIKIWKDLLDDLRKQFNLKYTLEK